MPKVVFIAHPIRGDIKANIESVLDILRKNHTKETLPFAPYITALQYLDDNVSEQRDLGIAVNKEFFTRKAIDELWLCGEYISSGMKEEVAWSLENGIPVKCYNKDLENELERFVSKYNKK